MPFHANHRRAADVALRLAAYVDRIVAAPREIPGQGWFVTVSIPGEERGLLFHPDQLDNGAAGLRDDALARILAFRDGAPSQSLSPKAPVPNDVTTRDRT